MKNKLVLLFSIVLLFVVKRDILAQSTTFSYTGTLQTWTVPTGISSVVVDAKGASGGASYFSVGGCGGRVQCTLAVTPGQVLNIYVGGMGADGTGFSGGVGGSTGGIISGGTGGYSIYSGGAGGGGGCSDIRIGGTTLANRVIVASGGGGGGYDYCGLENGGDGGGLTGGDGMDCGSYSSFTCGAGGSAVSGGIGSSGGGFSGASMVGGDGISPVYLYYGSWGSSFYIYSSATGGGGGGGYFGGGGGSGGGGGGGSSYASATLCTSVTHTSGTTCTDGTVVICIPPVSGTITGTAVVCVGATTTLSDPTGTPGGVWTSSSTGTATVGSTTGIVTGVAAGTATITYTIATACGTATATMPITVNPLPVAGTITGTLNVCPGLTSLLSDASPGGTWTSSTPGVATIGSSTGLVTGVAVGTTTITYSVTNSCGTATTTAVVTVNTIPSAGTITGTLTVCGGSTTTLSDAVGGGTWSSGSPGIATVGGTGIVTGVTAGTAVISYTVSSACGSSTATATVTVNAAPFAGSISGTPTVCVGLTTALTDPAPGGVWSSTIPTVAAVGTGTGVVTGVGVGTSTISYTVTNSCGTVAATMVVTVSAMPVAGSISGTPSVCVGAITALTDAAPGGVWSSSNPAVGSVSGTGVVSGLVAGLTLISYTVTNGCGSIAATLILTVNPLPNAGTILGTASACPGTTTTLFDFSPGGSWSSSTPGVATIGTSGVVTGVTPGTSTIAYTVTNMCGTAIATTAVTINPLPFAGTVSGVDTVCIGSTALLSDGVAGGVWSSGSSAIATVGSSTGLVVGVSAGTSLISYSYTNVCGTDVATLTVTVMPSPSAGVIGGPLTVCVGNTATLLPSIPGGTWAMTLGKATINTSGIVTGVTIGVDTIQYSVSNMCGSALIKRAITVTDVPVVTGIGGTDNPCLTSGTITMADATTGGSWTSSNTSIATIGAGTGVVTPVGVGVTNITYTVINGCGAGYAVKTITVYGTPVAGTITGPNILCPDSTGALQDTLSPGGVWSIKNTNGYIDVTGVWAGVTAGLDTVVYTFTNPCGSASVEYPVLILPRSACDGTGVRPLGLNDNMLNIHPNPNSGTFTLRLTSYLDETVDVTINNVLGEKVRSFTITTNRDSDVKLDAAAGIYVITARPASGGTFTAKVVVSR